MPVVQRIQRLQLLTANVGQLSGSSSLGQAAVGRSEWLSPKLASPQLTCAILFLSADCFALALAAIVASAVAGHDPAEGASVAAVAACVLATVIGYCSMQSHYTHRVAFWAQCRDVTIAAGLAFLVAAAAAFVLDVRLPRFPLMMTAILFPPAAMALRRLARAMLDGAGAWRIPVVVAGEGMWAAQAATALERHSDLGYEVVGRVSTFAGAATGAGTGWDWVLRQHRARLLVIASEADGRLPPDLVASLMRERVPYALLPQHDSLPVVGERCTYLGQDGVLRSYSNNLHKPVARAIKLGFDVAAASAALLALAPLLLVISALVGMDGGPVFYAHKRVGTRGRVFKCLKFRSMIIDSEAVLIRVLASNPAAADEWAHTHKLRSDPRVTWIGRILRKTSLDELPQLINVLRLEMSLVGPRPIVSLEIPKYAEDIAYYYETRPGITGLWQISGRSDTTYAQRVRLDSFYVRNWTLWRDVSILARTIPAVISGRGAG